MYHIALQRKICKKKKKTRYLYTCMYAEIYLCRSTLMTFNLYELQRNVPILVSLLRQNPDFKFKIRSRSKKSNIQSQRTGNKVS